MKINKNGQALIEFVLILPVLLLIIFSFFDLGRIIICKNHLESIMSDVVYLYRDKGNIDIYLKKDSDYNITYRIETKDYTKIILETKLDLITPGLKNILTNPYNVYVERSVLNE